MKNKLLLVACLFMQVAAFSQNIKNEKFGNVRVEDFSIIDSAIDNSAAAVVLSDVGSSEFEENSNGKIVLTYKRHKKILIKKNSAFKEATVTIPLLQFSNSIEQSLETVEASTYNIENGKIIETKLSKDGVVNDKFHKNILVKKFTLLDVKENCIVEYQYTIKCNNWPQLFPWWFQGDYPTLWSQYQVIIPPTFKYAIVQRGQYKILAIDSFRQEHKNYHMISTNLSTDLSKVYLWAMKNVPAFKEQNFMANPTDEIARYQFELHSAGYIYNNITLIKSWPQTAYNLIVSERFGKIIDKESNEWLDQEIINLTGNTEEAGDNAAKKIFYFLRDNFESIDDNAIQMSDEPKKIFKNKKGNVADINLLLTAMLYSKGYVAQPVILSKRGKGKASETSAILSQYNYVICRLKIDSTIYYLDASKNNNGFGKLSQECYNGYAWLIDTIPMLIDLSADNNKETKTTSMFIYNGENDKMEASFTSNLGYFEGQQVRTKLLKTNKPDFFKEITKGYSFSVNTENEEIENIKNYDLPLVVKYDMKFSLGNDDIIYFNPLLNEATKENIFKAEKRIFPVEMPFAIDETYVLDMEIPTGYVVDELPRSVRTKYNDDEGLFEYIVANKEGHIQLKCKFQLNKANYNIEDYESLRNFFGLFVKKQEEQIVFKKVKK